MPGKVPFREAYWIGAAAKDGKSAQTDTYWAFRKQIDLPVRPASAPVRITADARYILWVNGEFVGRGPARGFPWAQPYDEFDLAPFLKPGTNWIAAEVYLFGPGQGAFDLGTLGNGVYVSTGKTGMLIEGEFAFPDGAVKPFRTDATWQVQRAGWYASVASPFLYGCFAFQECVDARKEPSGWRVGQGSNGWQNVSRIASPGDAPWTSFEPRGLKPMRETLVRQLPIVASFTGTNSPVFDDAKTLKKIWQDEKMDLAISIPKADADGWVRVTPPAAGFVSLTFDLGWNPAAFPRIEVRQGFGGEVFDSGYGQKLGQGNQPVVWAGACDRFIAGSGDTKWQAFLLRGYRYHTVKVRADHPVTLRVTAVVTHHDVGAPLEFACSDPGLSKAWEVTDRTLRACMLDAFVDNNWREQTQWLHDGTMGALGAWATYGDTSLWRRLLWQAGQSSQQFDNGAVHSMPACDPHFQREFMPICDYSLQWISSLEQYHTLTGSGDLLRKVLPYLRGMMFRFVEPGFTPENLFVHPAGSTAFLDWTQASWDKRPYNLTMNLTVLRALRSAAKLAAIAGDAGLRAYCQRRDHQLTEAITSRFWSDEHRGWRENIEPSSGAKQSIASKNAGRIDDPWQKITEKMNPGRKPTVCTRHGNALAVLLKLGTPEQQNAAADLIVRAFDPKETTINNGMSPLWTDKIFGSLFEAGRDSDAVRLLQESYGTWVTKNGAMHWAEGFGASRETLAQLCGSSVNWLLTSYVLGIRPTKPGFEEAVFDPRPGALIWARGVVPTPYGNIRVSWKRTTDDVIEADIEAPKGVSVRSANANVHFTLKIDSSADVLKKDHLLGASGFRKKDANVQDFKDLVTTGQWMESWQGNDGKPETKDVSGQVWNAAIQAALDRDNAVHLPERDQPYYLDGPIILKSGQKLTADAAAEIRLKPGTNTCMVRNEHIVGFADQPVPADLKPDTNYPKTTPKGGTGKGIWIQQNKQKHKQQTEEK